jgi:hypothetical protein
VTDSYLLQGDIVYLKALGRDIVVLNSAASVDAFLNRRASISSDRVQTIMLSELCVHVISLRLWLLMVTRRMGWSFAIGMNPHDGTWRRLRRMLHSEMHAGAAVKVSVSRL